MKCECVYHEDGNEFFPCGLHATKMREAWRWAFAEARRIVEAEEELEGEMPKHLNTALTFGPREVREELLRQIVKRTKENILARLAEREGW